MSPLPRFLALSLFIVLAVLAVILAGPALRPAVGGVSPTSRLLPPTSPASARLTQVPQRLAFPLALIGAALALALAASVGVRSTRTGDTAHGLAVQRAEMDVLTKLAESSAVQGEQLAHERDARARAQADALLHQQRLNRSLEEQIQLGRDLHDGIIQSLYAVGLQIESARAVAASDSAEADRRLTECRQQLNRTIRDVRNYIDGLAPETLRHASFAEAVELLVAELGAGRVAHFDVRVDDAASARLSLEESTETLQIAREAVSNALRHGDAQHVTLRLHPGDGAVCLLVQDDGRGFDPQRVPAGHGLGNMRARAERIGGSLRIESTPGTGTRLVFTVPVPLTA
jgi:signal transduction histidine kinase